MENNSFLEDSVTNRLPLTQQLASILQAAGFKQRVSWLMNTADYLTSWKNFIRLALCLVIILSNVDATLWAQSSGRASVRVVKQVDKSKAKQGDLLTYTLVVTNSGTATASNVIVRDSVSTGLTYRPNSVSAPVGSRFVIGSPISTWTITELTAGRSLTMTIQAIADSSGVLYNTATVAGDTAKVCTSIPLRVCTGDEYVFRLSGPPNKSRYQWYRDGVELTEQTTSQLDISRTGSYSLVVNNLDEKCPDYTCCPFIVEEVAPPAFKAQTVAVNCAQPQPNGQLIVSDFDRAHTYQYSLGTSFNADASLSGSARKIPENGVIATQLPDPTGSQAYTVRVYNEAGCYTDQTVSLSAAGCCSLTATPIASACDPITNTYSSTVVVALAQPIAGTLTIADGPQSTTIATATGTRQYTAVFTGLIASGTSHTVTALLTNCSLTSTTYAAPASCTLSLALTNVRPGACDTPTNSYTVSGELSLTNAIAGTAVFSDGSSTATVSVSAGTTSVPFTLTGLVSGTGSHTVSVSYAGKSSSITYTAPVSCSTCPVPVIALANASQTVCAGGTAPAPLSVSVVSGTVTAYTWYGPLSSTATALTTPIVSATNAAYQPVGELSAGTYYYAVVLQSNSVTSCTTVAYASLTVQPQPSLVQLPIAACANQPVDILTSFSVTGGSGTTKVFSTSGNAQANTNALTNTVVSLSTTTTFYLSGTTASGCVWSGETILRVNPVPNAGTNQVLVCEGPAPTSTTLAATGVERGEWRAVVGNPASASFSSGTALNTTVSGLTSPGTYTFVFSSPESCSSSVTVEVPACLCAQSLSVSRGECNTATNQYAVTGTISLTNTPARSLTVSDGTATATVSVTSGQSTVAYSLTGLLSGSGSHTITVTSSVSGCGPLSATYAAPASCTIARPTLAIKDPCRCFNVEYAPDAPKRLYEVVEVTAQPGQSWRIVAQTGMLRPDTLTRTSVPVGTTLTETPGGSGKYQLTFTHDDGVGYSLTVTNGVDNLTIANQCQLYPSVTTTMLSASVCQSATPVALTATVGVAATTRFFYVDKTTGQPVTITEFNPSQFTAGELVAIKTEVVPQNPAQCSFTLVQSVRIDASPSFLARITPVSCTGNVAQANGRIQLSQFQPGSTYQYSLGSSFNANASLSGGAQGIPENGLIVDNLANPTLAQDYTVQVSNQAGCTASQTVRLVPTACVCPTGNCIPFTVQQIRGVRRR
ncbi:DUF7507 domain-containing protein [Spirosoma montaniterrae]|uniref:DUF11 domain-containing protein n=1 Tax=Spirosoma montaniterrae TaxID=1178516 RepID=A0A1P9X073_9BACT|nr:DUF11 domain-containing protein [Spirosoma montaniterrae]AQG81037.1 hypothetical protein AWR27_17955 [Spirosoma montaniterrae]